MTNSEIRQALLCVLMGMAIASGIYEVRSATAAYKENVRIAMERDAWKGCFDYNRYVAFHAQRGAVQSCIWLRETGLGRDFIITTVAEEK